MSQGDNLLYSFGLFSLDVRERVLTREGCVVPLTPKAFATLLVLVRNSGHVVKKDDLMKEVWPDAFVEEANLTQNIFALRRILGESTAEPQYIETVPRRGYRFVALVQTISTAAPEAPAERQVDPANARPHRTIAVLAVLPFVNESADAKMEYLSDGITESLINSLSELPRLRVMSRSAVFRYKGKELDVQRIGRQLGVDAVLIGRVHSLEGKLLISTELIDVANGWQLWGDHYDCGSRAIFEVQDEIAKQISATLRLRLTGDEEQRLTKRYTENAEAYQAYLKGRYRWSKYTREGLEHAVGYFRQALNLDPTYALAYAGAVDCYLRLATNYIRPTEDQLKTAEPTAAPELEEGPSQAHASQGMVNIRDEWDRKAAERESKRAAELKSHYPAAHQWHAAYLYSMRLYNDSQRETQSRLELDTAAGHESSSTFEQGLRNRIQYSEPTLSEQVQVFCTIARGQIDAGNYEAARVALRRWWTLGEWPKLEGLGPHSSADLLFTTGMVAGWVASTRQVPRGQKHAEALINGAIGIFEQLGAKARCAEGRIELGYCHYREGLFDLARITLLAALETLSDEDRELRSLALIRLASIARHAGRLQDALARVDEAGEIAALTGPWTTGRYHLEFATSLNRLAAAETRNDDFDVALRHFEEALHEFEGIGNHRYAAIVENNHGYLLLGLKRLDEAEPHLVRARKLFDAFADKVRRAQVDETLAQLYLAGERFDLAQQAIAQAVETLETGGEEALLAEALTTRGIVLCRLGRHREAKRVLDRANRVAESCGDSEGAGCALLIMIEEMCEQLEDDERLELGTRLKQLLSHSQQASILERLRKCLEAITWAHAGCDGQGEPRTLPGR
jgi:TolB-like protein/predicted negative regulator of RcsB-dependent stress response